MTFAENMNKSASASPAPVEGDEKRSKENLLISGVEEATADHIVELLVIDHQSASVDEELLVADNSVAETADVGARDSPVRVNSSPLTSVEDLHEVSRESISEAKESNSGKHRSLPNPIDDDLHSQNSPDNGVKEGYLINSHSLPSRSSLSTVKYFKNDPFVIARSEEGSIPSSSKKMARSEDSGATDSEEGLLLPGRKKVVLPSQINSKDRAGRSFIFKYAANGDYVITEMLLKAGASLRIVDNAGWTPLHEACLNGHEKVVEMLLSYNADVDAPGGDGDTPLHDAIGNCHFGVVHILLRHGASLHLHNENHQTPEEFAIEKYESLQAETEDDDVTLKECQTALKIVDLLKEWKQMTEKVVKRNHDGQTLLHLTCSTGDSQQAIKLFDYGADINAVDNSGWTPIHNAALNGREEVVLLLLRYGSEVDPLGMNEETPLHDAVANGHIKCASLLLEYGAEPFRKNRNGRMPRDLVPITRQDIRDILDLPLDFWHPVKTPEFYPRLLEVNSKVLQKQDVQESAPRPARREIPQHWEGLEPRGTFESSREEKKFQALLKTLSRTDNNEKSVSEKEKAKPIVVRQPQTSSKSATVMEKSDIVKLDSKKKRPIGTETSVKRPKLNPSAKYPHNTNSTSKVKQQVLSDQKEPTISKSSTFSGPPTVKKNENLEHGENGETIRASHSSAAIQEETLKRKPPKPKVFEKPPPPISKLHLAFADVDVTSAAGSLKKKKLFNSLSGYQAAGESSWAEVSSESIILPPSANDNISNYPDSIIPSTNTFAEYPKNADLTSIHLLFEPKPTLSNSNPADLSAPPLKKEKIDVAKKLSLEKNLCLPLCAYVKPQAGVMFFKPTNISREGLWGNLPKQEHTKIFVDMQIAYCLGLKNGRELLEKYPELDSRVATTIEKAALEDTIVSQRLFSNMILTTDPAWIPTTTIKGAQAFKMTDVDIHLIYWTENLFRILSDHVASVEKVNLFQLDWLEDFVWPLAADEPHSSTQVSDAPPKSYVHKLKRMKM